MGETPPKCQPAAVREDAYGGKGLFAIRDITSGEIVFEDTPLFTCPTDLEGMMQFFSSKLTNEQFAVLQDVKAQFEGLTFKDEEDIAQLCLPASERSDEDAEGGKFSDGIKRCSKVVKTRYEQFRRFVCVMKCNGHGVCYNPKEWSFFPRGLRANHSCSPNVSYRNIDNRLYYIALKDIQKQEEIVMAYIDGLFASTKQRQEKLIRQKLFICQCERCADTNDPCRKVACPHCRTTKTEAPDSAKDAEAGAETEVSADYVGNNKWHCRKCTFKFDETVMPVAVEQTLQNLYHQLDVGFIQPDAQTWLHYSGYLCTTAGNILGKNHWITAGAHYLLSRYYVGMWYGGNRSEDTMKVACFHADGFFAFIETNCPEARDVDATPWSSALMRMALQACDVKAFVIYARYLNRLKLLYGPWDATFRAYQEAVRYPFSVPHASTRSQPAPPRPPSAERPFQPVAPPATRPPEAVQIRVSADSWIPDARFTSAPATTLTGVEVMHQEPTGFQKPHGPPLMIPMPKAKQVYAMPTPHFDVLPSAYRTSVVGHPEPTPAASKERSRSPGAGHHRSITANFRDENGSRATVPVQPKPSAEDTPSHRHARPTGKGQRRHGPMPMPPSPNPLEPPPGRKSRRAAMKKPPELLGGRKPSACSPEKELLSVRKHEENPAVMPERSTIPVMMGYRPSAARVIHPQLFVNGPLLGAGHHPVIILPHGIPMQQRRGARPLFRPFPHE
eukprot:Polyplicarium_translucidae@DN3254_c0_g1_i5.p1